MTNKESQSVEYKQTWRNDCLKVISAFANSDGGVLFIGFDDTGKPHGLRNTKRLSLNNRQIKAVIYVKKNGKITNKEYREITGLSDEGARMDINALIEKKILVPKGKGRNVHYTFK